MIEYHLKNNYTSRFSEANIHGDLPTPKPKKLLDQIRDVIRLKHYSYSTEKTYVHWARRYILFHNKRHPAEMGAQEIEAFLTHLTKDENVSASTQNQALNDLLFLYRNVLQKDLAIPIHALRAKPSEHLSNDLSCGFGVGHYNVNLLISPLDYHGGFTQTIMLGKGSPAIDAGTGAGCPSTDQRGVARPQIAACDVGAVEDTPAEAMFNQFLKVFLPTVHR